jgi:hypothetical protein
MSSLNITSSSLGGSLQELLMTDEIVPGSDASYQVCKTIYAYHPLGRKMVDSPIMMAQSQRRQITVKNSPEARVREAFEREWERINADTYIAQLAGVARIYGVGSIVVGADGIAPTEEMPFEKLADLSVYFNVLDPLNTAGSLVLNQDPNSPDFQKYTIITAAGQPYHRGRACVLMNERPIYIEYTSSAFGYVGRSVYQRALYPLKSFINTMVADDMVATKIGVIIAKMKAPGSIIDSAMQKLAGVKRALLQEARTNNIMSIDVTEEVSAIDLTNVDGAGNYSRMNILKNIATAADMPAKMLENETMVSGFGEGTEDAKNLARYIDSIRQWMEPAYRFFDDIVMRRAWNEEFYEIIQNEYKEEYGNVKYNDAFYRWKNSFVAEWPSLLETPESDAKVEEVRQRALISMLEILMPEMDPDNKARVIEWAVANAGENKFLFPQPLLLDYDELRNYTPPEPEQGDEPRKPPKPSLMRLVD